MKRKALPILISGLLACSATAILFACGDNDDTPDPVTYSVTYVKSGSETGSVPTDSAKYEEGAQVTVLGKGTLARVDYTFTGWAYGGTTYTEGQKFTMPASNVTLTAQWTENTPAPIEYNVSYVLGEGAEWASAAPAAKVAAGTEITLPDTDSVSKSGMKLTGWTIGTTPYEPGAAYTVNGDVTITANWDTEKFSVAYVDGREHREVAGSYEAGTKIDVADVPGTWGSEGKEFKGWQHKYYVNEEVSGAVKVEDEDLWLVTETYQAGDKFTVPANNVNLIAIWEYAGINVNFYDDEDDFDPTTVVYKPDTEFEMPGTPDGVTVPEGQQFYWIYTHEYQDANYVSHSDIIVFDLNDTAVTDLLVELMEDGTEGIDVIGFVGKIVPAFTAVNWHTPSADTVNISYGQTVTLTGDMTVTAQEAGGTAHGDYEGIFVSVGKADGNDPVSVMMLYHKGVLNDHDGTNYSGLTHSALGVKSATAATLSKLNESYAYETIDYSLATVITMLGGIINNYTVVIDYTSATQIVVTTSFVSIADGETYKYEGVLTVTAADAHAGLAQTYKLAVCGESGSSLKNGKFVIEGTATTLPAISGHDWTVDNGYVCTICGDINPDHPHSYVEDVCTICGAVNPAHTSHQYGEDGGFCTICGNAYSITIDGTTYTADLTSAAITNNDTSGLWWDGKTSNVEIGASDQIAVISWEKTRDPNYYDVRLDITGEEGKDANDPWSVGGVFRLGPNVFEGTMTKGEQVVTVGTLPADATDGASVGSYKGIVIKAGNTMIVSLQCYRDGALFWSQTVTVDLTDTNLPTGTLYFRVAANPTFCDDFTAATGTLTAAE